MSKTLILITNKFPYGEAESFLNLEFAFLQQKFDKIIIVPNLEEVSDKRVVESEKIILASALYTGHVNSILKLCFNLNSIKFIINEVIEQKRYQNFNNLIKCIIVGLKARVYARTLEKTISKYSKSSDPLLYFYWANYPANASILLSKRYKCIVKYHGGDLYEELPEHGGKIYYREQLLKSCTLNIFVSRYGINYIRSKYPNANIRYSLNRLGVHSLGLSNKSTDGVLRILSCSNVTTNKRVELIAKALTYISNPVIWTHIGDGPELLKVKEKTLKLNSNIKCVLKGALPNEQVRKYYTENNVDLFLNVSQSEGIPVTIMEALSAGVPVYATDVGGTRELVDSSVGGILDVAITPLQLSETIISFINLSESKIDEVRHNAFQRFHELVNADQQFENFTNLLLSI